MQEVLYLLRHYNYSQCEIKSAYCFRVIKADVEIRVSNSSREQPDMSNMSCQGLLHTKNAITHYNKVHNLELSQDLPKKRL